MPDLHDLAHAAGWKACNLHDLRPLPGVGSVLYRSGTTSHNGRSASKVDDLHGDLSDVHLDDLALDRDLSDV